MIDLSKCKACGNYFWSEPHDQSDAEVLGYPSRLCYDCAGRPVGKLVPRRVATKYRNVSGDFGRSETEAFAATLGLEPLRSFAERKIVPLREGAGFRVLSKKEAGVRVGIHDIDNKLSKKEAKAFRKLLKKVREKSDK